MKIANEISETRGHNAYWYINTEPDNIWFIFRDIAVR